MVFNERFLTPMGLRGSKKRSKFVSRWKNRHFGSSFKYAVEGLVTAYREERNLRFHVGSVILVVIMGCLFHVSANEWLWLLLSIFFVLASEVWNTAIENAVDLASNYEKHPLAKKAKDTAAGGVLLAAVFSMIVGAVVFVPKIWQLLF